MNKRIMIALVLAFVTLLTASAQNKIDKLVERFSATGRCSFTSAVKRNPSTRRVEKVVKELEIASDPAKELYDAFMEELKTGATKLAVKDDKTTIILKCQTQKTNRIYMLKVDGNLLTEGPKHYIRPEAKVTIIIRMK